MNNRKIKNALLDLLDIKLKAFGFLKRRTDGIFVKETDDTKFCIAIIISKRYDVFEISMRFGLRVRVLEELDEKYLDKSDFTEKELKNIETYTLGCNAGHLVGERNDIKIWYARREEDLYSIVEEMYSFYQKACEFFFEPYSNLEKLYLLLCKNSGPDSIFCVISYVKAIKAILLHHILKKPNIEKLIENKKIFLTTVDDLSVKFFCEFLERFSNDIGLDIKHLL